MNQIFETNQMIIMRIFKIIGPLESTSKSNEKPGPNLPPIDDKIPRSSRRKIEPLQEQLHGEQQKDPNTRNLDSSMDDSDLERRIFTGDFFQLVITSLMNANSVTLLEHIRMRLYR